MGTNRGFCIVLLLCGGVVGGCGGGSKDAGTEGSAKTAVARSACQLLTAQEVSAAVGRPVTPTESERAERYSSCDYFDADGMFTFSLTAYWSGGKEEWDSWKAAQGLGEEAFSQAEGVSLDSIVKAGPVGGLGDAAYFSELLPSLVLKGDVLLEMKLAPLPHPEAQFRPLAQKALLRL